MHRQLIEKPMIIAILGKSASGKDTLAKFLTNYFTSLGLSTNNMTSMTTRPPRAREVNNVDYYFVTNREFNAALLAGELIEHTHFRGWQYGIPYKEVKPGYINIGVFNLEGLQSLRRSKYDYTIIPVYIEENLSTRLRRSHDREGKWRLEYFRRAVVDWLDFSNVKDHLNKFHGRYITLKNIDGVWRQCQETTDWLIRWGILKHSKEGNALVLGNFV